MPLKTLQPLPDVEDPNDESWLSYIKRKASDAWSAVNKPIVDVTPEMRKRMGEFSETHPVLGTVGEFATDAMVGQSSPLGLGLAAGAEGAAIARMVKASEALRKVQRVSGAAQAAHGLYNLATQDTTGGKVGGALEAGLGVLGYRGAAPTETSIAPKINTEALAGMKVRPSGPATTVGGGPSMRDYTPGGSLRRLELPPAPPSVLNPPNNVDPILTHGAMNQVPSKATMIAGPEGVMPAGQYGTRDASVFANYGEAPGSGKPQFITPTPETKPVNVDPFLAPIQPIHHVEHLASQDMHGFKPIAVNSKQDILNSLWEEHRNAQEDLSDIVGSKTPSISEVKDAKNYVKETHPDNYEVGPPAVYLNNEPWYADEHVGDVSPNSPAANPLVVKDPELAARNARLMSQEVKPVPGDKYDYSKYATMPPREPVHQLESVSPVGYEQPSAPKKPSKLTPPVPDIVKPAVEPEVSVTGKNAPKEKIASTVPYSGPIPLGATPKEAIEQWANHRNAARLAGDLKSNAFSDLPEGLNPVHAFQKGDRTGRLADVQKEMDALHELETKAGLLKEGQKKENYLRQYWEDSPEKMNEAYKQYVAKNPQFSKKSGFPTYEAGMKAVDENGNSLGLTPKYNNMNEIIGARARESEMAFANKNLRDWLIENKYLDPSKAISTNPVEFASSLQGPKAKELQKLIANVTNPSQSEGLKAVADAASFSKNISLAGGIPGTKYNMHAYNIARSDAKNVGYGRALKELFTDATGSRAEQLMTEMAKTRSADLVDLAKAGYSPKIISDTSKDIGKIGNAFGKVQHAFEAPLFEKSLPALSQKRTLEAFDMLMAKGMSREKALKGAAQIGNDFYGAANSSAVGFTPKVLRSKTANDLARVTFLAPEWLESRINLAARDYKGLAKTLVGKGTELDKVYAKSAVRGIGLSSAIIGGKLAADSMGDKPSSTLNVPLGEDASGKTREYNFGTSDEGSKVPIQGALKMYKGDPGALIDLLIGNKLSIPLKAGINVVRGQNDFGDSLKGKDKYGKDISGGRAIMNYLNELSKPVQYQIIQGMLKYANGDASLEEALSTGAELPLVYRKPNSPEKPGSVSAPRMRMRR